MPQVTYTGSVSSALSLNMVRSVSLSGSGAGSGQINWVKATIGMSTNAYGTTYTVTVTLKWTGGSHSITRTDIKMESHNYTQAYFDFSFPASIGTNQFTGFDISASNNGDKIFVKGNQSVTTDYTEPTRVTAPTIVSVNPVSVKPGGAATLSWSGAQNGVVNTIKHYEIHRSVSASSGYSLIGTTTSTSMTVYGHSTANNKYYYKVKTIGNYTGMDSDLSSAYATLDAPVSAVTAPTSVAVSPVNVAPGGQSTLSWSGATAGTNNPVAKYEVHMSTTSASSGFNLLQEVTGKTSLTVVGNATANGKHYYKVKSVGTYSAFSSGLSSAVATLTSLVTAVTSPSTVTVNPTSAAPGGAATLSWQGHSAGSNNAIKHFEVWRSPTSSSSGFEYLGMTTSSSMQVNARDEANKSYWFKVKAIGVRDGFDGAMSTAFAKLDAPVTAVTAPTSAIVPSISESTPSLTFSGAGAGTNNAISGYDIEYSDSTNGTTWGTWTELKSLTSTATSGTTSVAMNSTRGRYRKYRIRTKGAAGASFYSGWKETGAVKYNSLPTAPTGVSASPEVYVSGAITLAYSGSTDEDNNLGPYQVQYNYYKNNAWGTWTSLADNAKSHTPSLGVLEKVKYRVRATDTLGAVSSYVETNECYKNTPPTAVTINHPTTGKTTRYIRPRFLITLGTDAEGNLQSIAAEGYTFSRSSGLENGSRVVARKSGNAAVGANSLSAYVTDIHGEISPVATRQTTYTPATYTDPVLIAGTTRIKAAHMNELRANINTARQYYGLANKAWAETITAGVTSTRNWFDHVTEMRAAIMEVINFVNGWDTASTAQGITNPNWVNLTRTPSRDVLEQIRSVISAL